jgi:hypothetical protein
VAKEMKLLFVRAETAQLKKKWMPCSRHLLKFPAWSVNVRSELDRGVRNMKIRTRAKRWAKSRRTGHPFSLERGYFWGYLAAIEEAHKILIEALQDIENCSDDDLSVRTAKEAMRKWNKTG